jgi:hypothetical protein
MRGNERAEKREDRDAAFFLTSFDQLSEDEEQRVLRSLGRNFGINDLRYYLSDDVSASETADI